MEKLEHILKQKIKKMEKNSNVRYFTMQDLEWLDLVSVYPFNRFEYIINHLVATHTITLDQYKQIRADYLTRNKYLYLFEITAPRTFGETWAQRHLNEVCPELCNPQSYDLEYSGEYDFWYNGIKIEVKASRAVKKASGQQLITKALARNSPYKFEMNFQQLKPSCCDVFVWIAVWRDTIQYWVLSSNEVQNNQYYSAKQHRGNQGEGQLWIKDNNIADFECYRVEVRDLLKKIIEKSNNRMHE